MSEHVAKPAIWRNLFLMKWPRHFVESGVNGLRDGMKEIRQALTRSAISEGIISQRREDAEIQRLRNSPPPRAF